jgi:PAS domain S-box-containing protein
MNALREWLFPNGLMLHGFCYQWNPTLIWLNAISDSMIALAYFSIPAALVYFVRRRREIPFSWMFVCFSVFIAACGATHLLEVWTLWVPSYWFLGGAKILTASASIPTAIYLVRVLPTALSLPSPAEMEATNELLKHQAAASKESDARFRQMAGNIQEIFWMMDPETKAATYASPAFEQICELPLDSLYSNPTSYRELIHPEDLPRVLLGLEKLESTNRFDEEFRIVCPSGTVKWLRSIGFIVPDSVGKATAFVGTSQEITARKQVEEALRISEEIFSKAFLSSPSLISIITLREGLFLEVNESFERQTGYSRNELLGHSALDVGLWIGPDEKETFDEEVAEQGYVKDREVHFRAKSGHIVVLQISVGSVELLGEKCLLIVGQDITEQRKVEEALRKNEAQFSAMLNHSPNLIFLKDIEGHYQFINREYRKTFHFKRDEIYGKTDFEVFPPDQAAIFHGSDLQVIRTRASMEFEEVDLRDDGLHTSTVQKFPLFDAHGEIYAICGLVTDITDRKRADDSLRHLSGQLLKLQDEERRRISRDLHDSTGQDLVALSTSLSQLCSLIPSSSKKSRKLASQCEVLANRCLHDIRTLSYLLHPAMLDETGLEDAIRHYVDGFTDRTGVEIELELSLCSERLTTHTELALFRVVQESLTNIQRHTESPTAKIRLDRRDGMVSLEVSDKGCRTSGKTILPNGRMPFEVGVGIPSMQERVKLLGGQFEIESSHTGTTVTVTVPVDS